MGDEEQNKDLLTALIHLQDEAAFPGERNWGYDGVFPFAVQHSYRGPTGLARFVDAAHRFGLGVLLDVAASRISAEPAATLQTFLAGQPMLMSMICAP